MGSFGGGGAGVGVVFSDVDGDELVDAMSEVLAEDVLELRRLLRWALEYLPAGNVYPHDRGYQKNLKRVKEIVGDADER